MSQNMNSAIKLGKYSDKARMLSECIFKFVCSLSCYKIQKYKGSQKNEEKK